MARQPKQVHIFLYRRRGDRFEYALFQRSDLLTCWQGVCGGLENDETPEQGARRELMEEAGICEYLPLHSMECVGFIRDNVFGPRYMAQWGKNIVLVPIYYFAMEFDGEIVLSEEHTAVEWLFYGAAYSRLYFEDQQTALYELNERLVRGLI